MVQSVRNLFVVVAAALAVALPGAAIAQSTAAGNAAKLRNVIIASDPSYSGGAKCDGATDDTTAIQAALNAVPTAGGAVHLPTGECLVSAQLTQTKRFKLIGHGTSEASAVDSSTTILKKSTMTTAVLAITVNGTSIEGVTFKGQSGNTGDGIQISANRVRLTDVAVYAMGQDGIRVGTDAGVNANAFYFSNIKAKSNGRHGLHISDDTAPSLPNANAGTVVGLDVQANTSNGLHVDNARINTFVGIVAQQNTGDGVHLTANAHNNAFFGGDSENNTGTEIAVTSGATDNVFVNLVNGSGTISDSGTGSRWISNDGVKVGNVSKTDTAVLDWYLEGSWTPSFSFTTPGDLSATYSAQVGRYTRTGNRVTASAYVVTSAFTHSTASGAFVINGLPYTSTSTSNYFNVGACQYGGVTAATTPHIVGRVDPNTSRIGFIASGSGAANVNIGVTQVPSGGTPAFVCTVIYEAS